LDLTDDLGGEQQRLGPTGLVQLQVQAQEGVGRIPGSGKGREVIDNQPRLAQLAGLAIGANIADQHPLLIGGQVAQQRADGEGFHPTGVTGRRVAAGKTSRVQVHGPIDRHAAPVGHHRTRAESRSGKPVANRDTT
jgi:hypothetical protein